jgi:hypothetical protein
VHSTSSLGLLPAAVEAQPSIWQALHEAGIQTGRLRLPLRRELTNSRGYAEAVQVRCGSQGLSL